MSWSLNESTNDIALLRIGPGGAKRAGLRRTRRPFVYSQRLRPTAEELLAELEEIRTDLGGLLPRTAYGFIRRAPAGHAALDSDTTHCYWTTVGVPPGVESATGWHADSLPPSQPPDIFALQLLDSQRLDGITLPAGWRRTDLEDGHSLLEAEGVTPWLADRFPDPAVVRPARAAFKQLLQPEARKASKPP